jgi:para-nitrobenzyl esterase
MDPLSQHAVGDDWLTVNVWSPAPEAGAGLVLVWIQGGSVRDWHVRAPGVRRRSEVVKISV